MTSAKMFKHPTSETGSSSGLTDVMEYLGASSQELSDANMDEDEAVSLERVDSWLDSVDGIVKDKVALIYTENKQLKDENKKLKAEVERLEDEVKNILLLKAAQDKETEDATKAMEQEESQNSLEVPESQKTKPF